MQDRRRVELNGSNRRQWISPATRPSHFFKIILPSVIHDKKLRIPKKFVRKFGDELSAVATLTVPNGRFWHVGLEKADKKFWFHRGWQEFVEHHSIGCGYFLVFRYEGNSNFNVLIFDMTGSEIHYPCITVISSEEPNIGKHCPVHLKEEMEDDDSVEFLGSSPPCPVLTSLKNKVIDECVDQQTLGKIYYPRSLQNLVTSSFESCLGIIKHGRSAASLESSKSEYGDFTMRKKYKTEDQGEIIELVNVNESSQGKLLNKTKEDNQDQTKNTEDLEAPVPLVRDMGLRSNKEDQLLTKDAGYVQAATQSSRDIGLMFNGSKLTETAVEVGLHSSNEANQRTKSSDHGSLVKHEEEVKMLGTNIYPRTFPMRRPKTTRERGRAIHAARMFKTENPSFMVILPRFSIHNGFVYVPSDFARKYLSGFSAFIKLQLSDGRQWPVRCIRRKHKVKTLSQGWPAIVLEYNLEEGDVCVFELITTRDDVLKVSTFRVIEDAWRVNQPSKENQTD